ncbi:ThiF family adenylyltransferase [Staphylococcus kloosii]|uniref:ThiF family adenylyltransferase n=1 Tax=Staphylococcus kloosii TaxID=29384 RepID=UPI00189EFEFB|nr:ThiF family adenylyltransferase [Staphylococcus kloosii]MBF7021423.1 ThiF family adenylyltransferase [Staphylococcus kloosii]
MDNNRYSRQILFKGIGQEGQTLIAQAHVTIVGMGALGSHLAEGLVRAGIGELTIVDRDYIEESNLQRQTLYSANDAVEALPKVIAAEQALHAINKDVSINTFIEQVDYAFLEEHSREVNLILDATDNFDTRMLINDFAFKNNIPWIYGGVVQSTYVEVPFIPGETPCFNCLLPQLPAINLTCDTVGVIQPAVTMTTSLQLRDALKIITGNDVPAKYTYGDIWNGEHHVFGFSRMSDNGCHTCGAKPTFPHLNKQAHEYASLCGRDTVQYQNKHISQEMLVNFLVKNNIDYKSNDYLIMFRYDGYRLVNFQDGRFLIHNMSQASEAAKLMNKLFG